MFCNRCGTELPNDSQFCRKCGLALVGSAAGSLAVTPKPGPRIAIWFLIPILGLVVVWAVWQMKAHGYYGARTSQQSGSLFQRLHTVTIGTGALTVAASGFNYFRLSVPSGAADVKVQGHFTATGGAGNDIEVYLLAEDSFVNWQNGHEAPAFYNSGKVTTGDLNVVLPNDASTYYLVFNNRFSLVSPKAVQENMSLTYYSR